MPQSFMRGQDREVVIEGPSLKMAGGTSLVRKVAESPTGCCYFDTGPSRFDPDWMRANSSPWSLPTDHTVRGVHLS